MPDILPPEFQGTFREQLYAAKQWLDQYKMLLMEQLRQYELMFAYMGARQGTTEVTKVNTIFRDTKFLVTKQYELLDVYLYDDPVIHAGNNWFVQRHGDNRYVPSALETYGVIGREVSAENIYSTIESYLPLKYSSPPIAIRAKSGNGFLLLGVIDAEETEQGDNEEEEDSTE